MPPILLCLAAGAIAGEANDSDAENNNLETEACRFTNSRVDTPSSYLPARSALQHVLQCASLTGAPKQQTIV